MNNAKRIYPSVFGTLNVGQIELLHLIVFPALQVNYASPGIETGERM